MLLWLPGVWPGSTFVSCPAVFLVPAMSQHSFRTVVVAVAAVAAIGIVGLAAFHITARNSQRPSTGAGQHQSSGGHAAALSVPSPTPSSTPSPSPSASSGVGKSAPPSPPPSSSGKYPYPLDAGGSVVTGPLSLSPTQVAAGSTSRVTVTAGQGGWLAGQEIFVYLGQEYELTITGPGSSGQLTVAAGTVGSAGVVVSGFQFPNNNPAAPIAGYGTATLRVG